MTTSLLVTIVVMALVLAIGVGLWARSRRARPLVGALGWLLVPLGLYLVGVIDLAVNGIMSLVHWFERTTWDTQTVWGASLAGAGLLLALVAAFLPGGPKAEAAAPQRTDARRPVGGGARTGIGAGGKGGQQQSAPRQQANSGARPGKDGLTDEDREIEALLKRRGIM
ncbi:hypothetical protein [uncultured Tessaracoccus sp.]|uniref:hypothetical protein n=1 Tax=uncultured Tessaracoccus sp. TaxID=905023 RepID=UPI0025F7B3F0|nr:hypothetical protein [uncultured Tessaracoccus sp.]